MEKTTMRTWFFATRYRSHSTREEDIHLELPYTSYQEAFQHGINYSIPEDAVEVWYSDDMVNFHRYDPK